MDTETYAGGGNGCAIAVYEWEQNPESPEGYLRIARTKTVREVFEEVNAFLGEYPHGGEEYFSMVTAWGFRPDDEWPKGDIVCFSVNGSSEGDYTHVEVHNGPERKLVFLAKTSAGRDASWAFARKLADLLEVQ